MVGLKGNIYFAETTLILYQDRAGKGRVGGSALPSNKKLGFPDPTREAAQAHVDLRAHVRP